MLSWKKLILAKIFNLFFQIRSYGIDSLATVSAYSGLHAPSTSDAGK